ncbi:integrase [Flavobacterium chryseum]|uniref:tyrosine-type recombinase/integrase n=1 Tax=Flavobacterium sp. P3160 TaxID=2512113 RepID=UPI00105EAAA3|nr:tyrosine-type recombinase/integrase [Flavobacterium sp. P3160]TDO66951.1 integrase [Flavobacterium sp. P3160]
MKSIYTIPKVVKYDDLSKSWFIYFRYDKKLFRFKYGINYISNYKKREAEANILRDALHQKLKEGWNPLLPELVIDDPKLTLIESLDFAIEKKKPNIGSKTFSGYNGTIKFMKNSIEALSLNNLLITDTKRSHIKLIMEKAAEQRKWTNSAYNKHLNHLKAILSELIQWDIIPTNPAHKINNLAVAESRANVPASDNDFFKIKKEMQSKHSNFWNFCSTIFYTGIRPEEILKITLEMIDLENSKITLPPEITKTNRERVVPINQHLIEIFKSMQFGNLPDNYYLFGSFRQSGKGNVGAKLDFIPGSTKLKRDTATKRWERIVKKGLEINMNLYAMKKHGANKMILAGVSIDALKDLFGHTSQVTTQIYITDLKEINRKNILENAPAL